MWYRCCQTFCRHQRSEDSLWLELLLAPQLGPYGQFCVCLSCRRQAHLPLCLGSSLRLAMSHFPALEITLMVIAVIRFNTDKICDQHGQSTLLAWLVEGEGGLVSVSRVIFRVLCAHVHACGTCCARLLWASVMCVRFCRVVWKSCFLSQKNKNKEVDLGSANCQELPHMESYLT